MKVGSRHGAPESAEKCMAFDAVLFVLGSWPGAVVGCERAVTVT